MATNMSIGEARSKDVMGNSTPAAAAEVLPKVPTTATTPLSAPPTAMATSKKPSGISFLSSQYIVLLTVNDGFLDFLLNWVAHYLKYVPSNNRSALHIVAEDQLSYDKLQALKEYTDVTIERSTLNMESDVQHGTPNYKKMVSTRATHILRHLKAGRNVLYCDVDIVWLTDPFPYFPKEAAFGNSSDENSVDMFMQVDSPSGRGYTPFYCSGFMAVRSNVRTIHFMTLWEEGLIESPQLNQPIFNDLIHNRTLKPNEPELRHSPLSVDKFPSGKAYFKRFSATKRKAVAVVHNNFIIGRDSKKQRFIDYGLWAPLSLNSTTANNK